MPPAPTRRSRTSRHRPTPVRAAVRAAVRERASGLYRDAIVAAARDEFTDRGYGATKMVDIARRAGMSVGALYRHFDSKEAIFGSLMEQAAADVMARLDRTVGSVEDPVARIHALVATMLTFIEEHQAMFLVFQQPGSELAACQGLMEQGHTVRDRIHAVFRSALESGVETGALRDDLALDDQLAFVMGATHGFIQAWAFRGGEGPLADKSVLIARLILRALSLPGGPS